MFENHKKCLIWFFTKKGLSPQLSKFGTKIQTMFRLIIHLAGKVDKLYFLSDFHTLWNTLEWRKRCVPNSFLAADFIKRMWLWPDLFLLLFALRLDSKYVRNWRKTNGYPSSVIICHICCLDRYSTSILILRWSWCWAWLFSCSFLQETNT